MIYTIDEIRERVRPVADKYELKAVYLFGSYARGEAAEDSDVDLMIDKTGSAVRGMFDMGGLYNDLHLSVGKEIDLITTHTLEQEGADTRIPLLIGNVKRERICIYGE